ncbi:M20 family metallo-hydrolase [Virgibacillus sp. NKC19-3]|uniref:M20 family metallo-hydrolase n=1 Tax=Virgibacillus saliphilus TaxID=2831674 RepID=UPI001C9A3D3F|nr:M20 family metallo-hydrolase [Virgibacillus sp. NKC19-3]MBY7142913.1 M20 family metallo-hydrolase [Virgibacillus sp. NKC19-3]
MSIRRIEQTLKQFNKIGYTEDGINRLAYTENERKAKEIFKEICEGENLSVRMDYAGNMIARREGIDPTLPPVSTGSHLDTVINGGEYDGTVGVVTAIELIRRLNEQQIQTKHPVEIICFTAEESSRFGVSTIGSKCMAGKLEQHNVQNVKDKCDISLKDAFSQVGLNLSQAGDACRENETIKAFFEVHIEQGPVLEREQLDIGVATGIAAPTRLKVTVQGKASHSGTTPMNLRKDAFLGASEIGLAVEQAAMIEAQKGTVATVGDCTVAPGVMNVVPEQAEMKIDIRSINMASKQTVMKHIKDTIKYVESKRELLVHSELLTNDKPILLEQEVTSSISQTCEQLGVSYRKMPSGAGHDAMHMAKLCPTGLIFIPCRDGLSHHKDEFASFEAIGIGCDVLEKEVLKWAVPKKAEAISK